MTFRTRLISHEIISGLGFGLFLAIQGVFFLEKGLELWQIGVLFGVLGTSAALFEIPFGATADIYGRIKIYRISRLVHIVSIIALLLATQFWGFLIAAALIGLGQALSSGSVDAWVVERLNADGKGDDLQSHLGVFQASMAGGITLGAILGGYVPGLFPHTDMFPATGWNLVVTVVVVALHLLATPLLFKEGEEIKPPEARETLVQQIRIAIRFSMTHKVVRDLLLLGVLLGITIASVDAYWQPQLFAILGKPTYVIFGWVTAGYFAMAILGPMLISALAKAANISARVQVLVLPLILAAVLLALSLQTGFGTFIGVYLLFMLVFSMINPPVETLLNKEFTDDIRSSMQSILSFVFMVGGAISAFGFSQIVKRIGIADTWMVTAGVLCAAALIFITSALLRRKS
ncbi:MAG: MFS transporter [Paracoccaceae bacterium]